MLALFAASAQAADPANTVSAGDPGSIVGLLDFAGYDASIAVDDIGDPMISTEMGGWPVTIYFYGCDENTHQGCDSLQLSAGFDREEPWNAQAAIEIAKNFRFASVFLDEEGDPYVRWDIFTGEGIPSKVFLQSLRAYTQTLQDASELTFAEERAGDK